MNIYCGIEGDYLLSELMSLGTNPGMEPSTGNRECLERVD